MRDEIHRLKSLLYQHRHTVTVSELFEHCPSGDFEWDGEPEDVGVPWACDDPECESGWHESIQVIDMGRKDGRTWFVVREDSIAGCGDYQPVAGWDEREGDEITDGILSDLWFHLQGRTIEHFAHWGLYHLDVAESGVDPLAADPWGSGSLSHALHNRPEQRKSDALRQAQGNIAALRRMISTETPTNP